MDPLTYEEITTSEAFLAARGLCRGAVSNTEYVHACANMVLELLGLGQYDSYKPTVKALLTNDGHWEVQDQGAEALAVFATEDEAHAATHNGLFPDALQVVYVNEPF